MTDLSVKWAGLTLKSPIIVGSCNLTVDPQRVKEIEEAGAGAIVFKSLFEEQIQIESLQTEREMTKYDNRNAEMVSLFPHLQHAGPEEHLMKFSKVKRATNIPVIASINAIHYESWLEYAKKFEDVGADALELNFYYVPRDYDSDASKIEDDQIKILNDIKKIIKIPIIVKISPYYSNILNFIKKITETGAQGVVMFNRLFQPDIDIEEQRRVYPHNLSNSSDMRLALRYTALTHGKINISTTSASGIHNWRDAVKLILAGADALQVVSTLYKNGIKQISEFNNGIKEWMELHDYKSIDQFRGKLSQKNEKDPFAYLRAQYVDIIMSSGDIFKQNMPI